MNKRRLSQRGRPIALPDQSIGVLVRCKALRRRAGRANRQDTGLAIELASM
jgi:hypothetical protein